MTNSQRDLSALTKRAGSLAGRLGNARPAPAAEPETAPAEGQDGHEPEPVEPPPPPRRPRNPPAAKPAEDPAAQLKQSWSVYLPGPLFDRMRAGAGGRSYGEVVLDAFETVYDRLPERFTAPAASRAGLPPRTRRPRRDLPGVQEVHLRWTRAEFDVVEARRAELGAPNRSEFVTAIVELYLDDAG